MAKQTFTTGQVLTAAQMTDLQQTAMTGGAASTKTASYVLVAADAGTRIAMNAAGATTITVNTSLFSAGDTVSIQNIGAGTCTITAGTATVNTSGSLALAQYQGGILYFTSASTAIFFQFAVPSAGGGGKVLQVVQGTYSTTTTVTSLTMTDTGLSASITPTLASSKVLVLVSQPIWIDRITSLAGMNLRLMRGATRIYGSPDTGGGGADSGYSQASGSTRIQFRWNYSISYLDSPATTSSTTYKTQFNVQDTADSGSVTAQGSSQVGSITLLEIGV